jgi:hypothetical protein
MAGDVAAVAGIALTVFLAGALSMLIAIVAVAIRAEDRRTLARRSRQLALREHAPNYLVAGTRQVVGFGQRVPGGNSGREAQELGERPEDGRNG